MGKQGRAMKRALGDASDAAQKKHKKQKRQDDAEGEDIDCASLGFADALAVGLAFTQLQAPASAIEAFARAVALQPQHYGARCQLADACAEAGDHSTALTHYATASALPEAATDSTLWLRLGMAQAAASDHDAALLSYITARDLAQQLLQKKEGSNEDGQRAYGMALAALANVWGMERGDVDAAVRVYEDAVAAFPQDANLHFNLATMRLASGLETAQVHAAKDLRQAIALEENVVEFYEELVALLEDGEEKTRMEKKMVELRLKREMVRAEEEEEETKQEEESEGESEEEESEEESKEDEEDEEDE